MLSFLLGTYLGGVLVGTLNAYYQRDLCLTTVGGCLIWPLPLFAGLWSVTVPVVVKTAALVRTVVAKVVGLVNKFRGK